MDINKLNIKKIFGLIQENKMGLKSIMTIFTYLKLLLMKLQGQEYIYWLKYLAKMMSLGYNEFVLNDINLLRKMVILVNKSFQALVVSFSNKILSYIIFQVSILADLVKSKPQFIFPYDRKFVENINKLQQLTGKNTQKEPKLNLIISIVYFSISQNKQILSQSEVQESFKRNLVQHSIQIRKITNNFQIRIILNTVKNLLKIKNDPKFKLQMTNIFGQFINTTPINHISINL